MTVKQSRYLCQYILQKCVLVTISTSRAVAISEYCMPESCGFCRSKPIARWPPCRKIGLALQPWHTLETGTARVQSISTVRLSWQLVLIFGGLALDKARRLENNFHWHWFVSWHSPNARSKFPWNIFQPRKSSSEPRLCMIRRPLSNHRWS